VEGQASGTGSYGVYGYDPSSGGYAVYGYNTSGTGWAGYFKGNFYYTGSFYSSDERLKQDIKPVQGALDTLLLFKGVTYEWKKPEEHAEQMGTQIGFIAQDVEKVFPSWIRKDAEGFKAIDVHQLEALEVEAIRTLKNENDGLKVDLATLKDQVAVLANGGHPAPAGMTRFVNRDNAGWGFGGLMLGLLVASKRKKQA
jgi:hypothetical protein